MIFKSKKPLTESEILIEEQKRIKSDISYMGDQYDTFILKSLVLELPIYKNLIDSRSHDAKIWCVDNVDTKRFFLVRGHEAEGPHIRIHVQHNGEINNSFLIDSISCDVRKKGGYRESSTTLNNKKFKDILLRYILSYKINIEKKALKSTKESFEFLIDFIGKDVHRDGKIEEILK